MKMFAVEVIADKGVVKIIQDNSNEDRDIGPDIVRLSLEQCEIVAQELLSIGGWKKV